MAKRIQQLQTKDEFDKETQKKILDKYKVKAKTDGQQELVEAIEDCSIVLCCGKSGTGKTHISLGKGIEFIKQERFDKLVLFRPMQECGRQIGHLPGDKDEKLAPHVQTFMELLEKLMPKGLVESWIREGKIKMDIIEFARGTTFDNAYVVIDEAQNCTYQQLCMLITRASDTCKLIFIGDIRQMDLPERFMVGDKCAFDVFIDKLDGIDDDIGFVELTDKDIVRSKKLSKICNALGI